MISNQTIKDYLTNSNETYPFLACSFDRVQRWDYVNTGEEWTWYITGLSNHYQNLTHFFLSAHELSRDNLENDFQEDLKSIDVKSISSDELIEKLIMRVEHLARHGKNQRELGLEFPASAKITESYSVREEWNEEILLFSTTNTYYMFKWESSY